MARRRTKSVNNMQEQLSRMFNYSTATAERRNRATNTYRRYRDNIQRSLGYSNTGRGIEALNSANITYSNPRYQNIADINAAQVSRSTYMGLNNG